MRRRFSLAGAGARPAWFARLGVLAAWGTLAACGSPSHAADGPPPAPAADARAAAPAVAAAAQPPSENVRITLTLLPPTATAKVLWGKKLLGVVPPKKPLVLVRPRDSGPLDIVVRADGFLPVQTRIYTFGDSKLGVKLTAPEEKKTLLGYREPPPPPPAEESGAPGAAGEVAPSPAPPAADAGAPP